MTLLNGLIAGCVALAMMYTGLLFDPAWVSLDFMRGKLRLFAGLALVNYLAVPLLTFAMIKLLSIDPALSLALLTLSALPCAPLVPALVTMAGEPPEWPLVVFLGFSAVSLLVSIALIAAMVNSASYAANIGRDTTSKILQYVLVVYGPMALGAVFRCRAPAPARRLTPYVRALSGICMIGILLMFATVHRKEFALVSSGDMLLILGFVLSCSLLGATTSRGFAGPRLTSTISTTFRNIALGVAFTTVVLRRPDVTAYLVVYSAITLLVCVVLLLGFQWIRLRAASD